MRFRYKLCNSSVKMVLLCCRNAEPCPPCKPLLRRTGGHDVRPTCMQPARRLHVGRPHMNALPWAKRHPFRINSFANRNKAHNAHQGCWIRSDQQRSPAEVSIPASRLQVPLLGSSPSVKLRGDDAEVLREHTAVMWNPNWTGWLQQSL